MSLVRFDDALSRFAQIVESAWGTATIAANLFLRDGSGRLTFVLFDESVSLLARQELSKTVAIELGAYVDSADFAIATPEELFDDSLRQDPQVLTIQLADAYFHGTIKLIDRRMVGGDWLRAPAPDASGPTRFVFASIKGGVGRSTALCVVAAEFAKKGRRVLTIDMDLEAPGLGTFLLSEETLPEFGLLDFLVESEVGQPIDDSFLADIVSSSWLSAGLGRVDVIPAIGRKSSANPQNVLAKIARAYLADAASQATTTFQDRMLRLISSFSEPSRYDLILIDARAGLHETTAAALLGLGADVLLFGIDQPQTYEGYRLLFSHMSTLPVDPVLAWRNRLNVVNAKASPGSDGHRFSERMQELADRWLANSPTRNEIDDAASLRDTFEVSWDDSGDEPLRALDDEEALPIIQIYDDDRFRSFDPASNPATLSTTLYNSAFSELLELISSRLEGNEGLVLNE